MRIHCATYAPKLDTFVWFPSPEQQCTDLSTPRTPTVSEEQLPMDNDEDLPFLVPRKEQ